MRHSFCPRTPFAQRRSVTPSRRHKYKYHTLDIGHTHPLDFFQDRAAEANRTSSRVSSVELLAEYLPGEVTLAFLYLS